LKKRGWLLYYYIFGIANNLTTMINAEKVIIEEEGMAFILLYILLDIRNFSQIFLL